MYDLMTQKTYPSFFYELENGATTLWESWHGKNSQNHHMFSAFGEWFYKDLGGIQYDENAPAFKNIIIKPQPVGHIHWVQCSHSSMYGEIVSNWEIKEGIFLLTVKVPVNCTAVIHMPSICAKQEKASVGSGEYHFSISLK